MNKYKSATILNYKIFEYTSVGDVSLLSLFGMEVYVRVGNVYSILSFVFDLNSE